MVLTGDDLDPQQLALLHARCFTGAPAPWSAASIASALAGPGAIALGGSDGFLLGRVIAGEAELLTLAVAPGARRNGLGARLVRGFADAAKGQGALSAFLEVAEDNAAARALYAAAGWTQAGRRPGYYGKGLDALILRLALGAGQDSD
ncbi:GNAT family N-acetyltransferase [Paracoccus suum]|uniref:GNAT family N-acetyltransferase n=2 Tax=Paracoccus suum TaxID=2259340 RepID=A0A344PNL9_9RHOB|nr:GNAT family N-acetyltransferase [Paracoccus suum]